MIKLNSLLFYTSSEFWELIVAIKKIKIYNLDFFPLVEQSENDK